MAFQGIEFTPEMRQLVVNAKQFFDHNQSISQALDKRSSALTAAALGIAESTVKVIMSAFNKDGQDGLSWSRSTNRGRPSFSIESGLESKIRMLIRDANKNGRQVTLDTVEKQLFEIIGCKTAHTTLWRALHRWGFEFGSGIRSAHLKESERIILQRRRYLREKISNRNIDGSIIRPEVYLDESYINKNHSRDDTWFLHEEGSTISKPTGKGERLIIVNAITHDGWVPNAKLVFKASKKTDDYHSNMNWNVFSSWFEGQLLPNIPKNSIIFLDNAAYHNVLAEDSFPKKNHSIQRLRDWLTHNDIPWKKDMLKAELYELCSRLAPKPEFLLDQIAHKKGHSILRTPPYHPELQPIETCWAVVKNHIASKNDFTMAGVQKFLEEGFQKVTTQTIKGIMKKIRGQEDLFWAEDSNFLEPEDPCKVE